VCQRSIDVFACARTPRSASKNDREHNSARYLSCPLAPTVADRRRLFCRAAVRFNFVIMVWCAFILILGGVGGRAFRYVRIVAAGESGPQTETDFGAENCDRVWCSFATFRITLWCGGALDARLASRWMPFQGASKLLRGRGLPKRGGAPDIQALDTCSQWRSARRVCGSSISLNREPMLLLALTARAQVESTIIPIPGPRWRRTNSVGYLRVFVHRVPRSPSTGS